MEKQIPSTFLKPAEENPWYVLATICDQWQADDTPLMHKGSQLENAQVWNSWIRSRLDDKQQQVLAGDPPKYLIRVPEWKAIEQSVKQRFAVRASQNKHFLDKDFLTTIDFKSHEFKRPLNFSYFIFPDNVLIDFRGSKFHKPVMFNYTYSYGFLRFDHAHFLDPIDFRSARLGCTDFTAAIFEADCDFRLVLFKESVRFGGCEFIKPCDLADAQFIKEYPKLVNTIFREKINLSAKSNTREKIYWPDPKNCKQNPEQAKASCEVLRHTMNNQGLPEQAHFFFRHEMQFAGRIGSLWQRLPYKLFGWLSDYGYSIYRPAFGLMVLWFGFASVYKVFSSLSFTESLGLSIASLFQFTGWQRVYFSEVMTDLPVWLKILAGSQTIAGIVSLFLLGLGLRNRFRFK